MQKTSKNRRLRTARERRREEVLGLLAEEELAKDPALSRSQAAERARERIGEHLRHPQFEKQYLRTEPTSFATPRKDVAAPAEIRASLADPGMAWIYRTLQESRRGRPAERSLHAASLFSMAYFGRPDIQDSLRRFTGAGPYDWAFGFPRGAAGQSTRYDVFKGIVTRNKPGMAIHVNLDLLDRIASLRGEDGELRHPDAFKRCVVDGTLVEANVRQEAPEGSSRRERKVGEREMAGEHRPMASWVVHTNGGDPEPTDRLVPKSQIRKSCFGYNLVTVACMDLGLPVIWTLMPANGDERKATKELLRALYALRPDFPMEYLVSDGMFSVAEFIGHVNLNYGVHVVSPRRKRVSTNEEWSKTQGVPHCRHGLMKLRGEGEFLSPRRRKEQGLLPGEPPRGIGKGPRLRWACVEGKCRGHTTRPTKDWHLYTYLPYVGSHDRVALREALLLRRNTIESLFAQVKHSGPGSCWPGRTRWCGDDGARWILSAALLMVTAKRLAHESGAYDQALAEAHECGVLTPSEKRRFEARGGRRPDLCLESQSHSGPQAPSTWGEGVELPIDREFKPLPLEYYDDEPDTKGRSSVALT